MASEQKLTKEQIKAMDDDEFFEAYKKGAIQRRKDHLTEDNWEEVCCNIQTHIHKTATVHTDMLTEECIPNMNTF
jgi:hypothetical protein